MSSSPAFASSIADDGSVSMENDLKYLHGRVDPGQDDSIGLLETIPTTDPRLVDSQMSPATDGEKGVTPSADTISPPETLDVTGLKKHSLTDLPSELVDQILSLLSAVDLVRVSSTCRLLSTLATSDLAWYHHVQDNVPGVKLTSPAPCTSYRELYQMHDPHWFLTKYKIWFCDFFLTGKLILVRYDPRRGCIEGYRLVAERQPPQFRPWEFDDEVIIHSFEPHVRLHLDQPVIQLDALSLESLMASSVKSARAGHRFSAETPMRLGASHARPIFSNFLLTRPVTPRPNMQLWPPLTIPARERVRNASQEQFVGVGHKPQNRSEVSDQAFRIRQWMEMTLGQSPGVHLGEEVFTYATLDPALYTPTKDKPWRGIWMGDYSGHGVEFLLMHQPETEAFDEASVVQRPDETPAEWKERKIEARKYRGRLEAIKLTGDPNVPRGEHTFIVDDLGEDGYIRTVTEKTFHGARIVKSRGHIAARMFRNDKYIESQLILISGDRLAQYWVGFGHISFYDRVNIDSFLSPYQDIRQNNCFKK
ncbi:hypothetical protein BP5796_03084 [Coleophoma crateriformis]|uniref:F-box domain-containing protein n=1 Tax=Coleophoma crateriformis TaxID=565419 RepID=A0A3D8SM55_9HELO|nr:hypothetical protein BP5796_03084 [Coleophoma crateriformis]